MLDIICEFLETLARNSEINASYTFNNLVDFVTKKYYLNIVNNEKSRNELQKVIYNTEKFDKLCFIDCKNDTGIKDLDLASFTNSEPLVKFSVKNIDCNAQEIFKNALLEIKRWKEVRIKFNIICNTNNVSGKQKNQCTR